MTWPLIPVFFLDKQLLESARTENEYRERRVLKQQQKKQRLINHIEKMKNSILTTQQKQHDKETQLEMLRKQHIKLLVKLIFPIEKIKPDM